MKKSRRILDFDKFSKTNEDTGSYALSQAQPQTNPSTKPEREREVEVKPDVSEPIIKPDRPKPFRRTDKPSVEPLPKLTGKDFIDKIKRVIPKEELLNIIKKSK